MKKSLVSLLLSLLILWSLTACNTGAQTPADTKPAESLPAAAETEPGGNAFTGSFAFVLHGVTIVPGRILDLASLPEPDSVTELPSCAFEGNDNVYAYGDVEITAHTVEEGEYVYSVYFMSSDFATPEGVTNGDPFSKVIDTYGSSYKQVVKEYSYEKNGVLLIFIVQDDTVISIEYRVAD